MKPFQQSAGSATRVGVACVALLQSFFGPLAQTANAADNPMSAAGAPVATRSAASIPTASPIKHVIVIVGENRSFDHLFATYVPKNGNSVNNLLSERIVNPDGSPGPNFSKAVQYSADVTGSSTFQLAPTTG
jgi:phospholipase C